MTHVMLLLSSLAWPSFFVQFVSSTILHSIHFYWWWKHTQGQLLFDWYVAVVWDEWSVPFISMVQDRYLVRFGVGFGVFKVAVAALWFVGGFAAFDITVSVSYVVLFDTTTAGVFVVVFVVRGNLLYWNLLLFIHTHTHTHTHIFFFDSSSMLPTT